MVTQFEVFKNELQKIDDIKNFCLLVQFLRYTNNGNAVYKFDLINHNIKNGHFIQFNYILIKFLGLKFNKHGQIIVKTNLCDYLSYYVNDLQQIRL